MAIGGITRVSITLMYGIVRVHRNIFTSTRYPCTCRKSSIFLSPLLPSSPDKAQKRQADPHYTLATYVTSLLCQYHTRA